MTVATHVAAQRHHAQVAMSSTMLTVQTTKVEQHHAVYTQMSEVSSCATRMWVDVAAGLRKK